MIAPSMYRKRNNSIGPRAGKVSPHEAARFGFSMIKSFLIPHSFRVSILLEG